MSRLTFRASAYEVQVPASTANIGPGFDAFGMALELRDRYIAQVLDEKTLDVDVAGEGADEVPRDHKNLVVKAMYQGFDFLGGKPAGVALRCLNNIPHNRGLGSSATAIVGGLALARALVVGAADRMTDEDLLTIATEMEGHPDNVSASIYGGATFAWQGNEFAECIKLPISNRISAVAFIPESELATSKARKMLPESIPHADAVQNSIRTAMLTQALTTRPDLLLQATEDFLHQNYRESAMPKSLALMNKLRAAGVPAFISGAGPAVLALRLDANIDNENELTDLARVAGGGFKVEQIEIAQTGFQVATI
jgi:homoserine kinase